MNQILRVVSAFVCLIVAAATFAANPSKTIKECVPVTSNAEFDWAPDPQSGLSLWGGNEKYGYAFLFLGSFHNFELKAPHVPEIRRFFAKFQPTLVLYEGGGLSNIRDSDDAVRRAGEMGLVQWLAESCRVRHATFEPSFANEVALASKQYSPEQVKLYYIARLVPQYVAQGNSSGFDEYLTGVIQDKKWQAVGLANIRPRSIAEFREDIQSAVPNLSDWKKLDYPNVAPMDRFNETERGILNRVASTTAAIRDAELILKIRDGLRKGERVFVVAGTSHMLGVREKLELNEFRKR
jgi:hypothetical protein